MGKNIIRSRANRELTVVLINPNVFGDPRVPGSYRKARMPSVSLGLGALASYIEKNSKHRAIIIDARIEGLDPDTAFKNLQELDPDVVGLSLCSHESTTWSGPFLSLVKKWKPSIHTTLGNHFSSLFPEKALTQLINADSVVIGEGEITLLDLLNHLASNKDWRSILGVAWRDSCGKIIINSRRPLIEDINILPPPKRTILKNDGEDCELVVEGSRGCAFRCSFCTIGPFYGLQKGSSLRQKSAKTIYSEIKQIRSKYPKLRRIRFVDPEFFIGESRPIIIKELAELICNNFSDLQICVESRASSVIHNVELLKLLKKAGLMRVNMGIESGSQKLLDKMNKCTKVEDNIYATKILRELDIDYSYGFMMITPWSLDEDIEQNIIVLKQLGKIEPHRFFHELSLIPGTAAFEQMVKEKGLSWKGDLYYYTYKTDSERIERYRKLIAVMELQHNSFFKMASFIYESIRALVYGGYKVKAEIEEKKSDELFLDIFGFCWEAAKSDLKEEDFSYYAKSCVDTFSKRMEILLKALDPALPISIPSNLLPKYATIRQV